MPSSRIVTGLIYFLLAVLAGCGSCVSRESTAQKESFPAAGSSTLAQQAAVGEPKWSLQLGDIDAANRYPFTVKVIIHDPADRSKHKECSGVLVSPQLVLTAGHCVCQRQEVPPSQGGTGVLIDASRCSATATVVTETHSLPSPVGVTKSRTENFTGKVRPHPQFKLLLDSNNTIISSTADLATILLNQPVEKEIAPLGLASEPAKPGDQLIVVGYGYIEGSGALDGQRRFSQEPVTGVLDPAGERLKFGRPELATYQGDTGGPCLREGEGGPALVGISARGLGREPTCTSTLVHHEWLQKEIESANLAGPHGAPGTSPQGPPTAP